MSQNKKLTRCPCTLSDCHYFNTVPGSDELCDCSHPEKHYYMHQPCPLYKKQVPTGEQFNNLKERFLKKKRKL